jgi:hypothetical protein
MIIKIQHFILISHLKIEINYYKSAKNKIALIV